MWRWRRRDQRGSVSALGTSREGFPLHLPGPGLGSPLGTVQSGGWSHAPELSQWLCKFREAPSASGRALAADKVRRRCYPSVYPENGEGASVGRAAPSCCLGPYSDQGSATGSAGGTQGREDVADLGSKIGTIVRDLCRG